MSDIVLKYSPKCEHNSFCYDDLTREIFCVQCGTLVDPVNAIKKVYAYQRKMQEKLVQYHAEKQKLEKRKRTKCHHCKKFTDINLNLTWAEKESARSKLKER